MNISSRFSWSSLPLFSISPVDALSDPSLHPSLLSPTKRFLDILGALVGLAIMLLFLLPIAIAMQIDSPGALFYSQIRCGLDGQPFRLWKFRSMVVDADSQKHLVNNQAKGHIFKNFNDPRITHLGKFLRRTSLDEFPQFWNVLKGEMSLVGTRPPTPEEVAHYEAHHFQRLKVKPGLTGEWQVRGRSKITDFEEIVQLDLEYQHQWSIRHDLMLILKTIQVVLTGRGAC